MITLKKPNNKDIYRAANIKGGSMSDIDINVSINSNDKDSKSNTFFELTKEQIDEGSKLKYAFNGPFRNCLYICASSGSGKSYLTADLIKQWRKRWYNEKKGHKFKGRVFLISPKDYDEPLDTQQVFRIRVDNENFVNEDTRIQMKDFENSLVIFDDCEALTKELRLGVMDLLNKILTLGRSYHISCINIVHQITNFRESRIPIIESDTVIIFPKSGLRHQYERFLKIYCGYSKDEAQTILELPTDRYIIIHKNYPRFFMTPKYLYTNDYIYKLTKDRKDRLIEEREMAKLAAKNKFKNK